MDGVLSSLFNAGASRREIEETFDRMIVHLTGPDGGHGCLINNCMIELAARDPSARRALVAARARVEDALASAAERGQAQGTITALVTPRSIGRFLLNTLSGLEVAAKGAPDGSVLLDIATTALRILD